MQSVWQQQVLPSSHDRERVRYFRPPELPGVELMVVERSDRLWRAFHESYAVCLPPAEANPWAHRNAWSYEWWYRGRVQSCPLDGLMAVEPGELHVTRRIVGGPASFWVARLAPELLVQHATALGLIGLPRFHTWQTACPDTIAVFRRFYGALRRGATRLEQESLLSGFLRTLLTTCAERPVRLEEAPLRRPGASLFRARDYLHAHFTEPVSLDHLAHVAGLSRYPLVRGFARAFGLPPHRYQIELRVAAAREQLRRGTPPALVDVGFADQSHLGRHFKAAMGTTLAAFARGDDLRPSQAPLTPRRWPSTMNPRTDAMGPRQGHGVGAYWIATAFT